METNETKEGTMKKYRAYNAHSGLELGVYEGETARAAYLALCEDAGSDPRPEDDASEMYDGSLTYRDGLRIVEE